MRCRERLEKLFADHQVAWTVRPHREVYTAQEVAAVEKISGYHVAKVVIAMADGRPIMAVLPAPYHVDLEKLRRRLDARETRLAREEEFARIFPDCEVGAMPPFGNLYGVPVYADETLAGEPSITFKAGTHRETITVNFADFRRLTAAQILDLAGRAPSRTAA